MRSREAKDGELTGAGKFLKTVGHEPHAPDGSHDSHEHIARLHVGARQGLILAVRNVDWRSLSNEEVLKVLAAQIADSFGGELFLMDKWFPSETEATSLRSLKGPRFTRVS